MTGWPSKWVLVLVSAILALSVGDPIKSAEEVDRDQETVHAISSFSVKLAKDLLQTERGNLVIEPLGVATVLAQLLQGVENKSTSSNELQQILGRNEIEARNIGKIGQDVQNTRSATTDVLIGSKLFLAEGKVVKDTFKRILAQNFNNDVTNVPFTQPGLASNTINNWASKSTKAKVSSIVTPGALSPDTRLVLANAAYFKGVWQSAFTSNQTKWDWFYLSETNKMPVWIMHQKATLPANLDSNLGAWWVRLPVSEKHAVVFVLPERKFGLDQVVQRLSADNINDMARQTVKRTVDLYLPRFSVGSFQPLKAPLQKLGVHSIFDQNSKLTGILENGATLIVSDVLHRAKMEIDEKGVTAAAVTAAVVNTLTLATYSEDIYLRFDQPFLAIVVDQTTGLPIFIARIINP